MALAQKFKSYLLLHFVVFIWGFTAILGELISISAVPLVWFRMGLASVFMLGYILYRKENLVISRKQFFQYLFGGITIALHWITFFYAIKVSNISIALATMSTGAFFALLIEAVVKRKRINGMELCFGLLAILGLYIIYSSAIQLQIGMLFALLSSFLSALFSVFNADYVKVQLPSVVSFYEILFGVLAITIYISFNGMIFSPEFFQLQAMDYLWIGILSSICTAYAFIVSLELLKKFSAFTVMLTINLEPIYAIVLAVIIFPESEKMTTTFYIGATIILLTVLANGVFKLKNNKTKNN